MRKLSALCALTFLTASVAAAHPHFQKTTTVKIGDQEVSVSYFTVPANMKRLEKVKDGEFVSPGQPALKVPTGLETGSATIPPGTYLVGAIKQGSGWGMVLYPGEIADDEQPDLTKVIRLDSQFFKLGNPIQHLTVDIVPGSGGARGMTVLLIGFGGLRLDGVISEKQ